MAYCAAKITVTIFTAVYRVMKYGFLFLESVHFMLGQGMGWANDMTSLTRLFGEDIKWR